MVIKLKLKTKDAKTIFETVTPYHVVDIKSFTTTYYKESKFYIINNLNERYILTKYSDSLDSKLIDQDYDLTLEMQGYKYIPNCLYYDKKERIKITERIYPTADLSFLTKSELRILANSLRGFHKLKHTTNLTPYNPFEVISSIKSQLNEHILSLPVERNIIKRAKSYYFKHEKFICHNFLLRENVIINKRNTFFFNYDFMGSNDPLYDIAMLFFSLEIKDEEIIRFFLSVYYGDSYNEEKYEAYLTYVPLVKLVLIYELRKINKEYDTHEFNDTLTNLILELRDLSE